MFVCVLTGMPPRDDIYVQSFVRQYAQFLDSIGFQMDVEEDEGGDTDVDSDDEIPTGYLIATDSESDTDGLSDWSDDDDDDLPTMEEIANIPS